jgi:hypothetical protein
MYPPGMMPSMPHYGPPHPFYSGYPSAPPPNDNNKSTSNTAPPSSPPSIIDDPVQCLEDYIKWHIRRSSKRESAFEEALSALNYKEFEFKDIARLTEDQWDKMGIKEGISMALQREMEPFLRWKRRNGGRSDARSSASGGASSNEADSDVEKTTE